MMNTATTGGWALDNYKGQYWGHFVSSSLRDVPDGKLYEELPSFSGWLQKPPINSLQNYTCYCPRNQKTVNQQSDQKKKKEKLEYSSSSNHEHCSIAFSDESVTVVDFLVLKRNELLRKQFKIDWIRGKDLTKKKATLSGMIYQSVLFAISP